MDGDIIYELLADIDALFFEINATWEPMKKMFSSLHKHAGKEIPENIGKKISCILAQNDWFQLLDKHRNFFMHEGAPSIAIDLSNAPEFDLLIMKENVKVFSDPNTFVPLSDLNIIVEGFSASKQDLQRYLVSLFETLSVKTREIIYAFSKQSRSILLPLFE